MNVTLLPGRNLDADIVRSWKAFQWENPALANPFFSPELTQIAASAVDGVEVAALYEGSNLAALFPFQRSQDPRRGIPVAGILSDYQGLICPPGFACDPHALLRQCGLVEWKFDHLLSTQECFAPFVHTRHISPQIDLSCGYDAYVAGRLTSGSDLIKKLANMTRRIEREIGPLRFVAHEPATEPLEQVLAWKSQQYMETGAMDILSLDWVRAIVNQLHLTQTADFAGMLSLLYAGDQLIAGHFGIRSRSVWHYYLPTYDKMMAKYSPGSLLLQKMAEHAAAQGMHTIDLGKGMMPYKERFMSASVTVTEGCVEMPSLGSFCRTSKRKLQTALLSSRMGEPARELVRWVRAKSA